MNTPITLWLLGDEGQALAHYTDPTREQIRTLGEVAIMLGHAGRPVSLEVEGPNYWERIFDSTNADNLRTEVADVIVGRYALMVRDMGQDANTEALET